MRDNKNDWLDSIGSDDLRKRLLKGSIPVRKAPEPAKKPKLKHRFRKALPKKLENPVDAEKAKKSSKNLEVTLNLSMPKVDHKKYWSRYKSSLYAKIATAIALVIIANVILVKVFKGDDSSATKGASTSDGRSKSADYKALLPGGDEANTSSGKAAYEPEKQVTSFSDKIGENSIVVSEQPLPPDFKDNPDGRVEIFAKNNNFNELLQIESGRAHLGTSIKGPQSVVFQRDGVMVFLRSEKKIMNTDWVRYINNLSAKKN